jgi:hypothetical protein
MSFMRGEWIALVGLIGVGCVQHPIPEASCVMPRLQPNVSADTLRPAQLLARSVTGVVIDRESNRRMPDAVIRLLPIGRNTFTDSVGRFRFAGVPNGEYTLQAHGIGWRAPPVRIRLADTSALYQVIVMQRDTTPGPCVITASKRSGWVRAAS